MKTAVATILLLGLAGCHHEQPHFVVERGYIAHNYHFSNNSDEMCMSNGWCVHNGDGATYVVGHQWQSRRDGTICGTTTPEPDGEWGFNQLETDIPHIEFDTEKEAFDFGAQWCQP